MVGSRSSFLRQSRPELSGFGIKRDRTQRRTPPLDTTDAKGHDIKPPLLRRQPESPPRHWGS
jgi:hypothetical protein